MYVCTEGLFNADAAPFLRRFSESLKGDVPIVVPAVLETTCRQVRDDKSGHPNEHILYEMCKILDESSRPARSVRISPWPQQQS